jgi:ABC-type branched-subunit amino acid transport system ATPase component
MEVEKNAIDILGDFKLYEKRNSLVQSLSYGQQKLVALGRLLIGEAEILLIDEPTSGVHPLMINEILATIKKIAEKGKTVLMIEHNIPKAFSISDAVHVMDDGKIEITGTPSEVMNNPALTHIYTGI